MVGHLRSIAAGRDRSAMYGALVYAIHALFGTTRASVFRVLHHANADFLIPYATTYEDQVDIHDAYLTSPRQGHLLDTHPLYRHCCDSAVSITHHDQDGHCHLVPVSYRNSLYALLDLRRPTPLSVDEAALLDELLGFLVDHVALIDYAETDTLTGLLNRKTFDENLDRVLASAGDDDTQSDPALHHHRRHARKTGSSNWLAVVDIDHFKRVNDTYGHIIGDEVLLLVAQQMRQSFRFGDQLFRFGGEEFVAVLQPTPPEDAQMVLERFRSRLEAHEFPLVGRVTVSIGFTRIDPMATPTELVGRADQALYFAKQNGRNRVESYETLHDAGLIGGQRTDKPKAELF